MTDQTTKAEDDAEVEAQRRTGEAWLVAQERRAYLAAGGSAASDEGFVAYLCKTYDADSDRVRAFLANVLGRWPL
jgi:hypothetical protein